MSRLQQSGHRVCNLCDLHSRIEKSQADLRCIDDYFPSKNPDIMVILGNLPDDFYEDLSNSDQISGLTNLIKDVFPHKTIGFTSAVKCFAKSQYIKQCHVNRCTDHYFKNLMQSKRATRYIIMGVKAINRIVGKSYAKGKLYDFKYGKFVATDLLYLILETDESKNAFKKQISILFDKKLSVRKNFELNVLESALDIKSAYEELKDSPIMAVDIEASGLPYRKCNVGHRILCCSFTKQDNQSFIFPLDSAVSAFEQVDDKALSWETVTNLLTNNSKKIFHYGKYDVFYFKYAKGITVHNYCEDTLYISYLLDERPPHGLKELTNKYIPEMIGYDDEITGHIKSHKDSDPGRGGTYFYIPNRILFPYCGLDTIATWKQFQMWKPELLKNEKQTWTYNNIMMPVNQIYMNMERRGVHIDRKAFQEEGRFLQKQISTAQTNVIKYLISKQINANINLNSHTNIAGTLLELKECSQDDLTYSMSTRKYSCDDILISKLIGKGSKICRDISTFLKKTKLKTTYVDAALAKCDQRDRIHTNFNIHTTSTGRPSSKDPNLQNQPQYIRRFYGVLKGKIKFEFDCSQLELRLMACASKDPVMLRMYHPDVNQDLHTFTAAGSKKVVSMVDIRTMISAGKIDDMIKLVLAEYNEKFNVALKKRFRRQAKSTNFHMIYGGMVDSLMRRINQDLDKNIRELIMEIERNPGQKELLFPQIQDLKDAKIKITCKDCTHWSYLPFGSKYSKIYNKMSYVCPECGSMDVQSDAQEFYDAYFELYPLVKVYQQETAKFLAETGYVESMFGRRRHLPDIWSDNRFKQIEASNAASNHPIQSAGADLKYLSLIEAERLLKKNNLKNSFIDCEVHDSITGETTPQELVKTYRIMKYSMEKWPSKFPQLLIPFPVDCKLGLAWGDMTDVKGEEDISIWLKANEKVLYS